MLREVRRFELDDDGMGYRTPATRVRHPWADITEVAEAGGLLLLCIGPYKAYPIPFRAFGTASQAAVAATYARTRVSAAHGASPPP